jgi:membrane protein implicated in regulation of membrane protease activity
VLRDRAVFVLLVAAWWWVAWGYEHQRFAAINWAADYWAVLFALQGAALLWVGVVRAGVAFHRDASPTDPVAIAIVVAGLVIYPCVAVALGRPWLRAEVFALMPEPTAIATLGFLLLARPMPRWLFIVPVASCLFAGAMLWALHASEAWLAPLAAVVSLACLWAAARHRRRARRRRPPDSQRDSRRDSTRDSQRGPRRDSQRDSVRDSQRDSRRDPGRNSKR